MIMIVCFRVVPVIPLNSYSPSLFLFKETYKPKRIFKKPSQFAKAEEETQVHSTLLEYGQRFMFSGSSKSKQEETEAKHKAIAAGLVKVKDGDAGQAAQEEEERKLKLLMDGMSETDLQQVLLRMNHTILIVILYVIFFSHS